MTLEQELAEMIEATDYEVRFNGSGYLHCHVYYLPARAGFESGEIGCKLFSGWRKYERGGKWARKTIRQHKAMIEALGGVKIK